MLNESEVREKLISFAEPSYRDFSSALVPGCGDMLGVRLPILRKLASDYAKEDPYDYLENSKEIYFEEKLLKGFIIGALKCDLDTRFREIELFVPKISDWSVCDSFCASLKSANRYQEEYWAFLEKYWRSDRPFEIRFAVVMYLGHFVNETYLSELFARFDKIDNDNYYVKMGIAWAVSVCYVKFPKETIVYLKDNRLDDDTFNKSLQKIVDSHRVEKADKDIIKSMRRKR